MTDRELLEAAAKAAGIVVHWDSLGVSWRKWPSFQWNPLTDDGDALRLAVKLDLIIDPIVKVEQQDAEPQAAVWSEVSVRYITEPFGADKYAATRRAIVRAAAALGDAQ